MVQKKTHRTRRYAELQACREAAMVDAIVSQLAARFAPRPSADAGPQTCDQAPATNQRRADTIPDSECGSVKLQLERLMSASADANARVGHLEDRLGPVLQNHQAESTRDGSAVSPSPRCTVAEMLDQIAGAIELLSRRVTNIRDRVDL
jgi:hypothetical protein